MQWRPWTAGNCHGAGNVGSSCVRRSAAGRRACHNRYTQAASLGCIHCGSLLSVTRHGDGSADSFDHKAEDNRIQTV